MSRRQRDRKQTKRQAHAEHRDNRRPKGAELLSDIRRRRRSGGRAQMLLAFATASIVVAGALWFLGASAMDAGDRLFDGPQPGMRGVCR